MRDEISETDYVVLSPEWLGTHIIGNLLSAEFLSRCRINGCYSVDEFASIYPEITEPVDLLRILDTLQLCAPIDIDGETEFEFPAFNIQMVPRFVIYFLLAVYFSEIQIHWWFLVMQFVVYISSQ